MATALQNRLVGTVILVALAVIFLPDILDGEKQQNRELFVDVPPQPAVTPVIAPETFPADEVQQATSRPVEIVDEPAIDDPVEDSPDTQQAAQATPQQTEQQIAEQNQADTAVEQPPSNSSPTSLAEQTVIEQDRSVQLENAGWVIQLGSFRHQKNVRDLLAKLDRAGYRAFSRPVQTNAGVLTKVFVGPDLNRENLDNALPHLKEETGLVGRITPFTVE